MKIIFATHNLNKLKEVKRLVPKHIQIISLDEIGCHEDIPETQNTIEGNALQKAAYVKKKYGHDCFADDTGLEVQSLGGAPGVYSARYAGEQKNSEDNLQKLLLNLQNISNRTAQFKTVIALELEGQQFTFTGICRGCITDKTHGDGGFGYDSIFRAKGYNKTFAELSLEEKNLIGHRGKAVSQLIEFLSKI